MWRVTVSMKMVFCAAAATFSVVTGRMKKLSVKASSCGSDNITGNGSLCCSREILCAKDTIDFSNNIIGVEAVNCHITYYLSSKSVQYHSTPPFGKHCGLHVLYKLKAAFVTKRWCRMILRRNEFVLGAESLLQS